MKRNETLKQTLILAIRKKTVFLIVMVSAPCMEHDMPIPMVIISLYPKHIQVGEERMQVSEMILLNRILINCYQLSK